MLFVCALPAAAEVSIDRLIARLGERDWHRREAAGRQLLAAAERRPLIVVRRLVAARAHPDLEVRARGLGLLERLDARAWYLRAQRLRERKAVGEALRLGLAAGLASPQLASNGTFRQWLYDLDRQVAARGVRVPRGEDELFLVQDYAALAAQFPKGRYAAYSAYARISGQLYFGLRKLVRMADPGREAKAWPRWLARHPNHPGADDAWYRLSRARELTGDVPGALLALERVGAMRDGDMAGHAEGRRSYLLDAVATPADLQALLARKQLPTRLRRDAARCLGVSLLRAGRYAQALKAMDGRIGTYAAVSWDRRRRLAGQLAALVGKTDAASRYQRARLLYHNGQALEMPCWGADGMRAESARRDYLFRYRGKGALALMSVERQRAYLERATGKGAALRGFEALVRELPGAANRDMALYSAATAAAWLADHDPYQETALERSYLKRAVALYRRVAGMAGSPLARAARRTLDELGQ